jgi:hypothetical protein
MDKPDNRTSPEDAQFIIDELGGTGAVAKLCGIKDGSVSGWKTNGISELRTEFLRNRRPEVFAKLAKMEKAA